MWKELEIIIIMLKCLTAYLKIFRKRECRKNTKNDFSAQKSRRNLHFRVCHSRYKFQEKIFKINYLKRGRNIFEKKGFKELESLGDKKLEELWSLSATRLWEDAKIIWITSWNVFNYKSHRRPKVKSVFEKDITLFSAFLL